MSTPKTWLFFLLRRLGPPVILGTLSLFGLLHATNVAPRTARAHAIVSSNHAIAGLGKTDNSKLRNVNPIASDQSTTRAKAAEPMVQQLFTTTVALSPRDISHEFSGAGVHIFDSDYMSRAFTNSLDTLDLQHVRAQFGPNWDHENIPEPPACNQETYPTDSLLMYNFVADNFNGDFPDRLKNAKTISDIAEQHGMEIILLNWRAFEVWLTDLEFRELKEEKIDDYACFVAQFAKFLKDEGVKFNFLEPTNEPSNTQDTKILPVHYNSFVKLVRTYLNIERLTEVRILSPSLAYFNHDNLCQKYIDALDSDGVRAISVWALHAWDPEFAPTEAESIILQMKWQQCVQVIRAKEKTIPVPPKPIFVTESACVNDPGNGVCAAENLLTLYDLGANAVIYWYLRAQDWDPGPNAMRALLTETHEAQPTYTALSSVLPYIAGDNANVLETNTNGRITAASFHKVDSKSGKTQVTISLANRFTETEAISLDIDDTFSAADQIMYDGGSNTLTTASSFARCPVIFDQVWSTVICDEFSLPPNSILTLTFTGYNFYLPIAKTGSIVAPTTQ